MAELKPTKHAHNFQDLTNKRFGRWTVLSLCPTESRFLDWLCRCDCGTERPVHGNNLRRGLTVSCGCYQTERRQKYTADQRREYKIWHGAKSRCINPENKAYPKYGQRGITMCERWCNSFFDFFADMGPCPKGQTLDRIDNDGPYSPDNCRWATKIEQQSNRRVTVFATFNGDTFTVKEWARITGQPYTRLLYRVKHGLPILKEY